MSSSSFKYTRPIGATSNIFQIFIADSSVTTGAGLTGLTSASGSLVCYRHRDTEVAASVVALNSMTIGTFTSGGFKEIDSVNMPGWYQFCPPDAGFVTGAQAVVWHLKGAANMTPTWVEVELVAYNPQDAVRLGLTALPNAAAGGVGGVPLGVDSSGRVDVLKINGTSQTARDIGASVLLSPGTGTGQLSITSGIASVNTTQFAGQTVTAAAGVTLPSSVASPTNITAGIITTVTNLTNAPTAGDFTATMKSSLNAATPAVTVSDKTGFSLSAAGVQAIWDALTSALTTVGSVGKRIADFLTGDAYVRLGAPAGASVSADVAAIKSDSAAIKAKTDNLPASPAAVGSAMTLTGAYDAAKTAAQPSDVPTATANADALLKRDMSAVSGEAARSPLNALRFLRNKWSVSGTTLTVCKEDDVTSSWTATVSGDTSAVPIVGSDPS